MDATLLADLLEYRKDRDKAVVAAARSLLQLFRAKLGHVLLVAGHTLHHAARTHPTPGHEHVLLEASLSLVSEWCAGGQALRPLLVAVQWRTAPTPQVQQVVPHLKRHEDNLAEVSHLMNSCSHSV